MTTTRISQQVLDSIPLIPEGDEWAGHYYWDDIEAALTRAQWEHFRQFMVGQTCGLAADGRGVVYAWDVERWVHRLPIID